MKWFLFISLFFFGCQKAMTNDEIISEIKKCQSGGMDTVEYHRNILDNIYHIQCLKIHGAQNESAK